MTGTEWHDVCAVIHVHSRFSDGTGTVEEIAAAAERTGAQVVLLTDHDTLEARRRGLEGWHGSVLVLVGVEVTARAGHLLAFETGEEIDHDGLDGPELLARVDRAGGWGVLAHPFSRGARMSRRIGRPHPWRALRAPGFVGLELWSLETDALEAALTPAAALRFLRDPASVEGPPPRHLAAWDELCRDRPVVGVGGLDAHQKGVRLFGQAFSPTSYEAAFATLRTHLLLGAPLTGETSADAAAVFGALRAGRCYVAVDALADATGFRFWAGDATAMGGAAATGAALHARLPRAADMALLRDGEVVARAAGDELDHEPTQSGAHRVQAWLERDGERRTWIVSNPIYVQP